MTIVTLQFKKSSANNLEEIYQACDFSKPDWSWYEPRPESLLNNKIKSPIITLANEIPRLDGIEISEMMLFKQTSGLTVVADADRYRYFHWFETNQEVSEDHETIQCEKSSSTLKAYINNNLEKQYGIFNSELPNLLGLISYTFNNSCVAWTLVDWNNEEIKKNR